MEEQVTQVNSSKENNGKLVSVICTRSDICQSIWSCTFNTTSLLNIAHFVVELFNSATLNANLLHLRLSKGALVSVKKSTEDNTFTHYLEDIASQLSI